MMTNLNRILSLTIVLTVPVFFMACEGNDRDMEDEGALSTPSEGFEDVPTESEPMEAGTFSTWDTDADASLTEDEFNTGLTQENVWTRFDADADDALNQQEFDGAFADSEWYVDGLFTEWDADGDGNLTEDEWESGLFTALDADDDDNIQEDEYDDELFAGSM